jgi:hypothetical protein
MPLKQVRWGFLAFCLGIVCFSVTAGTEIEAPRSVAPGARAADEPVLSIDVRPVASDAKVAERKYPKHYDGFEKRINELDGKPVLELLGNKLSIQLLKNAPRLGARKEPYTGADFICAILRGKVASDGQMRYALQDSQECLVTSPDGEFRVGIFYRPVGYVVLPKGECYWFLFEEAAK